MQQHTVTKHGGNYALQSNGELVMCPYQANYNKYRIPEQASKIQTLPGSNGPTIPEQDNIRYACGSTCPLFSIKSSARKAENPNVKGVVVQIFCGCKPVTLEAWDVTESLKAAIPLTEAEEIPNTNGMHKVD